MIKIMIILLMLYVPLNAVAPLVKVAQLELDKSKIFLKYERHQRKKLYAYTKLVKVRYLLSKELVWVSTKIVDGIYLQSCMIRIMKE